MTKKSKSDRKSIDLAAQAGAAHEVVDRYGNAEKQHFVAYSGLDNETGKELKRGLKKNAQSKINPDYKDQNIKQQAGFAAEGKYTARQNAEKIINKEDTRYIRTDDLGRVNDDLFDHFQLDGNGNIIIGSGEQMKFVGSNPRACLNKLASEKFQKYLDADAKITVPSDYYSGILQEADKEIVSLKRQIERAKSSGNAELEESLNNRLKKIEKIKSSVKDSGVSNAEAIEARVNPKLSTAKDVLKLSHRAGLEQAKWGAGISGGISLIRNIVAVAKGEEEPKDAAVAVVKDTGTGAAVSYATAFAGATIKGAMQNGGNAFFRTLSKTNAPAAIVTATVDIGRSMSKLIKGQIDAVECLEEIGEKGVGHISAAMFATVGQLAIPIPVVGSMVGSMIGYALSSASYKAALQSLKDAKIAKEERVRIESECNECIQMIVQYRIEAEAIINKYLAEHRVAFSCALAGMDESFALGDIDEFIRNAGMIQTQLGYQSRFKNMDEFNTLMQSDEPFKL